MKDKKTYQITDKSKLYICRQVNDAPIGYAVMIGEMTRYEDQSRKFHAMCNDVSQQAAYIGKKRTAHQWKVLFISGHAIATGLGAEMVPGLEGEYVNIRESSAQMGVRRMASLIEYVSAWCAGNGIRLSCKEH